MNTMRNVIVIGVLALVVAGGLVYTGARAAGIETGGVSEILLAREAKISRDQATATALQAFPGTTQEVELERLDGRVVYEVLIKPATGAEMEVFVDAVTGEIVKIQEA